MCKAGALLLARTLVVSMPEEIEKYKTPVRDFGIGQVFAELLKDVDWCKFHTSANKIVPRHGVCRECHLRIADM